MKNPSKFDAEYGVIQNTYVEQEPEYNSNRRTVQSKKNSRLLPGVSPLVYSRFPAGQGPRFFPDRHGQGPAGVRGDPCLR